jgi:uncharacterized NAD(P)/FAD-binding protein YdhS
MKSDPAAADVVIIGGGYSGTMLAAQLGQRGMTATIVEGRGRAGKGTAFSTPEVVHLLNVPATKMSAWPDKADDFADSVAGEGYQPTDFVPRRRFGAYVSAILAEARASGRVTVLDGQAVEAEPAGNGWIVTLADGSQVEAEALALAHGNQPPERLRVAEGIPPDVFVNDPWSDEGRAAVLKVAEEGGDVLIVGTGLTMVDVVLSLDAAGHQGRIVALSRRGLTPRAHASFDPVPVEQDEVPHGSVRALWRWLRKRGAELGWRAAVDSLRPHSQGLWQSLDEKEQKRFLRHARPWWDVHRHRIAPEVAAVLKRLIGEGRLEIVAGRIKSMREGNQELVAGIQRRGKSETKEQHFALGVNCTGPLGAIGRSEDGVLRSLFDAGLAKPDWLGMGLDVDGKSRVAGAERLWAVGPLTKGRFWEIVAVPDIRGQVADVAKDISEELHK